MTGRRLGARRPRRRAAVGIVAVVVGGGAWAQSVSDTPPLIGFPAGPFVIAPSLTSGYSYESNVYQRPDAFNPQADQALTVQPALALTLPFSNSTFRLADEFKYLDYRETTQTAGKTSNLAEAELTLNFASHDKLDVLARHVSGVAETLEFDPGGEVAFQGNAYQLHSETVSVSRETGGARGYRVSIGRQVLKFTESILVTFVNYSGFDGEAAYLQPLSPNTRLAFGYVGSRYDQYQAGPGEDPSELFRTERGDTLYAQFEGQLGTKQPYSVRLGWETLDFGVNAAANGFSGLIGHASLSAIVGGGTTFTVVVQRQPYRSSVPDNNYYVFEEAAGQVERRFPLGSIIGGRLSFSQNTYGEPSSPAFGEPEILRRDRTMRFEGYANLAIADHFGFRVSVSRNRKYSNFPGASYNDTVVFGGFVLGWI